MSDRPIDAHRRLLTTQRIQYQQVCDQNAALIREQFTAKGVPITDDTLSAFLIGVRVVAAACGINDVADVDDGNPFHVSLGMVCAAAAAIRVDGQGVTR